MSKTKPQGMMIKKDCGFLANSHVLIFAVIDHKTTNIPEISQVFIILSEFHRKIHRRCLQKDYKSLPAVIN